MVVVDAGLSPGRHIFRLEVVGARERRSQPTEFVVDVVEPEPPVIPGRNPIPGPIR